MKMTTKIPPEITTPDSVETSLGTLKFFDGLPDQDTVQKVFDNLDRMRGVDVFLNTLAPASLLANIEGLKSVGCDNHAAVIHEDRVDAKTLLLTPNTQTATLWAFMDLRDGPLVVEVPPGVLGLADDAWMRYIIDLGLVGPDKGKGGRYLFLPPGHTGAVPEGYFVAKPDTYKVWLIARGFSDKGDTGPAVKAFKDQWKVYPLAAAANPPKMKFINGSGLYFNTIHAVDFTFFEEVNKVIQEEPADSADPEILGQLAAIGIVKGKPFAPDARMKKILTDAVAIGNATARALSFKSRDEQMYFYPGKSWFTPFVGGSHEFIQNNVRLLDARTVFFYMAIRALQGIHDFVSVEPVQERDKVMIGMLAAIGIEKGKPFNPSPKMQAAMERAVVDAYHYMQELTLKLLQENLWWPDRHWAMVLVPDESGGFEFITDRAVEIDKRAAIWFPAIFLPPKFDEKAATAYISAIADKDGKAVEAGKLYRIRVPKDTPAKQFWSITVYDMATWGFIINPQDRSGLGMLDKDKMKVNDDGSVDVYVGPKAPDGLDCNWIPTADKVPVIWLRLYGPDEPFWKKTFKMPDIELVK